MTRPLLRLRGIRREFAPNGEPAVTALDRIDLDVYAGEFVAITGPSGGGKSTLLAVLGLLDTPTGGTYFIGGIDVGLLDDRRRSELRARTFGFVFQAFHLLDRRPVRHSVDLGMVYRGVRADRRTSRTLRALRSVGLADRSDAIAGNLSGGERQRIAVARAIAGGSPIILADEPTGNLDSVSGARVMRELEELHAAGATVLVVTHSEELAARATRRVEINDGRTSSGVPDPSAAPSDDLQGPLASGESGFRRLRVRDLLLDVTESLTSRTRESATLALAVAVAVAMLIVTLGLSASASAQVSGAFDARANREVTVTWQADDGAPTVATASKQVAALPDVQFVAGLNDLGEVSVRRGDETLSATLRTMSGDVEGATRSKVDWIPGARHALVAGTAILGAALARQLELPPLASSPTIVVDGRPYGVIGVLTDSTRMPLLVGGVILSVGDRPDGDIDGGGERMLAIVTVSGAAAQVGSRAAVVLDPFSPDRFRVDVPVDPQGLRADVENGVGALLAAFTGLAVAVATLTLTNTIAQSVRSRRSEFGLRRAVGARARDLRALVSLEAITLGAVGGAGGYALGVTVILAITISQRWQPVFEPALAPIAIAGGTILAAVSSLLGAHRAARIDPSEALRA